MILIAPTEPKEIEKLLECYGETGMRSPVPEELGADYVFLGQPGRVCVQRKTIKDLISSVMDGRLQREVAELGFQDAAHLLVEGSWSLARKAMEKHRWDRRSLRNTMLSVTCHGIAVERTANLEDTAERLSELVVYWNKPTHQTLLTRPLPPTRERLAKERLWRQVWMLQALPHVGPKRAARLVENAGGAPLLWTCTFEQFKEWSGLGDKQGREAYAFIGG